VNRFPRPKPLGQISPWRASLGDVKQGIDKCPVRNLCRFADATFFWRQQWLDTLVLIFAELMTVH
jgi:hypothetical protein